MRNGHGIELVERMKRIGPAPCMVVVMNQAGPEIRGRCIAAGAACFFGKSTGYHDMVALLFARSGAH